jgi:hypothetical protein
LPSMAFPTVETANNSFLPAQVAPIPFAGVSDSTSSRRALPSFMAGLTLQVVDRSPPMVSYSPTPIAPRPLPETSRIIPTVPRGENGWQVVVSDWEMGDESRSLPVPLKDWPEEWYSGAAGKTLGTLYNNRRLIATEFIKQYVPLTSS